MCVPGIVHHFLPPSPSLSSLVSTWRSSVSLSVSASTWFTDCVRSADADSESRYNSSLQLLVQAQAQAMADNDAVSAAASATSLTCQSLSLTAIAIIQAWQSAGAVMRYNEDSCSAGELLYLRELIGDGGSNDTEAAASTAPAPSSYVNLTSSLVDDAVASVDARVAYDVGYVQSKSSQLSLGVGLLLSLSDPFPSEQLSEALTALDAPVDGLLDCVYGDVQASAADTGGLCSASLASLYQPVVDELQLALSQAQSTLESALSQAAAYSDEVLALLQSCAAFFAYLRTFSSALSSVGLDVPIPSLPPLAPFSFDGAAAAAEVGVVVDGVAVTFARLFQPAEAAFRSSIDLITAAAMQTAVDFTDALRNASLPLPDLLSDYQPPPVDLQVQAIALTAQSAAAAFAQQVVRALSADPLSAFNDSAVDDSARAASDWIDWASSGDSNHSSANATSNSSSPSSSSASPSSAEVAGSALLQNWSSASSLASSLPSSVDFSFVAFSGSVDVDGVVDSLAGFFLLLLILDYAWRSYRSLHTAISVLQRPNEQLPPVDTRPRLQRDSASTSSRSLLVALALHPAALYVAMAALVSVSLYPLAVLYLDLLWTPYISGCVGSRNGTLLTVNAGALLYNAASAEGRLYSLALLSAFDARAAVDCATWGRRGLDNSLDNALSIQRAQANTATALTDLDTMRRCIDPRTFHSSALPLSPTASAFSLPSPFTSLLQPPTLTSSCSASSASSLSLASALRLAALDCSALPQWGAPLCSSSTSTSTSTSTMASISRSAWHSGCQTEYAVHSALLLTACVLSVFVCMNVSRALIVQGWVRLLWWLLCPAGLTALVHVGESGVLEKAAVERMKWSVQDRLEAYRREALHYLLGGLMAHIPYILLLALLAYTVQGIPRPMQDT